MAMYFPRLMADGSVEVVGWPWGDCEDRAHFRTVIPKGCDILVPYEELIQYGWIESNDAGLFARGGRRGTFPFAYCSGLSP